MKKALVLLSGGQDSTTCLFWAKKKFHYIEAIGFDYCQRHIRELKYANKICEKEGIKYSIIKLDDIFSNSALITQDENLNIKHPTNNELPNSFVPGRNLIFLSIASAKAINNDIFDIVIGVCETDYSGYPDCRKIFIDSIEKSINLAHDKKINIHTPLMKLDKAKIWKLAKDLDCLDVIINDTITDYNGSDKKNEWGFGNLDNKASKLRSKGYYKAKSKNWI
tara:strand:- start:899 stop:1564 length:666 start_codon:yes stop_codon:yes gene_type:complete